MSPAGRAKGPSISARSGGPTEDSVKMLGINGSLGLVEERASTAQDHYPNPPAEDDVYSTPTANHYSRRFSHYDSQRFDLSPSASPAQAKRALEAHLADTDKRISEASKIGTSLVERRRRLSQQLKEVEKKQADVEIGPELRQKLIDFEAEFEEVGRETARAFLQPRSKLSYVDDGTRPGEGPVSAVGHDPSAYL